MPIDDLTLWGYEPPAPAPGDTNDPIWSDDDGEYDESTVHRLDTEK